MLVLLDLPSPDGTISITKNYKIVTANWLLLTSISIFMLFQIVYFLVRIRPFLLYEDTIKQSIPLENKLFFLIIVKNEYHQLKELLSQLRMNLDESTVIAVLDDHSDSDEAKKMAQVVGQFSNVEFLESSALPGKKNALYQFIESTNQEIIVLMDADCRLVSADYQKLIANKMQSADLVLGYAPFFKEETFVNRLSRFDCMWIGAQYLGWAKYGDPYMAVGRNMSVKADMYKEVLADIKAKEIISGDDDMLVQAIGNRSQVGIMVDPKTFVFSKTERTYSSLLRQKTRQIGTSFHYKLSHKLLLGLTAMSSIVTFPLILFYLFNVNVLVGGILLGLKIILSYVVFTPIARKLQENDLILFIPLWELIYGIHLLVLAIYGMFSKKKIWK